MSLSLGMLTFDCEDAARLAAFWSAVLDRPVDPGATADYAGIGAVDEGPDLVAWLFVRAPAGAGRASGRFHPDLTSPDWEAEADRVVALGATLVARHAVGGVRWVALRDPEGNAFNIFAPRPR